MKSICSLLVLIASAAAIDVALAQPPEVPVEPPAQTAPAAPAPSNAPLTDTKIDRFAKAYIEVEEIQREAAEKLGDTTDSSLAARTKLEADKRVNAAIRRAGLEPAEFDSIAQRMSSDDELKKKIAERVAQRRGL